MLISKLPTKSVILYLIPTPLIVPVVVWDPVKAKVDPSKVKFASASNSVVVEPIVTSSLAVALFIAETAPEEASSHAGAVPAPVDVRTWPSVP